MPHIPRLACPSRSWSVRARPASERARSPCLLRNLVAPSASSRRCRRRTTSCEPSSRKIRPPAHPPPGRCNGCVDRAVRQAAHRFKACVVLHRWPSAAPVRCQISATLTCACAWLASIVAALAMAVFSAHGANVGRTSVMGGGHGMAISVPNRNCSNLNKHAPISNSRGSNGHVNGVETSVASHWSEPVVST